MHLHVPDRVSAEERAASGEIVSRSPIDPAHVLGRFAWSLRAVDQAVALAEHAQPIWDDTPMEQRLLAMSRLRAALSARKAELAALLTEEIGKPSWEARAEVEACLQKIDITTQAGLALVRTIQVDPLTSYTFRPHGVVAVIGPFNFPLHLVHGHVIPALLTGNVVIVKPSELAPAVSALYADILASIGLPPGVFQVVQGEAAVGERLAAHRQVNAVLFTGSYSVGRAIERACLDTPGKLVALEMGGRNPALVLSDAPLEKAAHDVLWGAFVTSGQRCSGTALCLVDETIRDRFVALLREKAARIVIGDPRREDVFMGPLVSHRARERARNALEEARAAGAKLLWEGNLAQAPAQGAFLAPTLHDADLCARESSYHRDELFAPDLAVQTTSGLEHALSLANSLDYGLSASVFTERIARFELAKRRLGYGNVNWNAPTCGASPRLPFGGLKKSGNHRPAALFSTLYCTYPTASLLGAPTLDPERLSPGMNFLSQGASR